MPDQDQPVQDPQTQKIGTKTKVAAIIALAAAAIAPFTMRAEGTVYKAYRDPIGKWTICNGHTQGVKPGDVATKAQCEAYLREDLAIAMKGVVAITPNIVENINALKAAGDFTLNSGAGGWKGSPMAKNFEKRNWVAGCNSFSGYYAAATFKSNQPRYKCVPRKSQPGKWLCQLPGLVKRRNDEKTICLTGVMPPF